MSCTELYFVEYITPSEERNLSMKYKTMKERNGNNESENAEM